MKKLILASICAAMAAVSFASCGSSGSSSSAANSSSSASESTTESAASDFDTAHKINVCSREDGSGTRGAFIELMGIEQKDSDGNKVDMTTVDAQITNSTAVMMTTVAGDPYSIGYISLGSLDKSVKALQIDGMDATVDNIVAGTYPVARPFNIITSESTALSDVAQDFYNYILSDDGQAIVSDNGYISVSSGTFVTNGAEGKITVAGSSSVSPVMEKLAEAYQTVNTGAKVEIQTSDSTTGVTAASEGSCDIGMASRDLKDTETGVTATEIAKDGIAVIVNLDNPLDGLTTDQVMKIYTGEQTDWSGLE
ncbi:MAG: substrate-binding domain-containing protein [Candidatus Faecivivens sp.]|nr:substrate-binding domain-containing protein [Oscillospiraceae bacterium]MDY2712854.1 substrate-binding domain-containing protein [Candidatus Faecivivens sp.]